MRLWITIEIAHVKQNFKLLIYSCVLKNIWNFLLTFFLHSIIIKIFTL